MEEPPRLEKQTVSNYKKVVNNMAEIKGKLSGQRVPHCHFYFVTLLVFLVISIRF